MVEVGTSIASLTPLQIRVRFRPEAWVLGGGALKHHKDLEAGEEERQQR